MTSISPFHVGEQSIQARLGVRDTIEPWARRIVRPFVPQEHREFYSSLSYVIVAARDASARPWATLLTEEPGFVSSPDPRSLHVAAAPPPGDALAGVFRPGDDVGLLGIELHTRRRNRLNGRVTNVAATSFALEVDQTFGNCPQYITQRHGYRAASGARAERWTRGSTLSHAQQAMIERADTFFIATGFRGEGESPSYGMDASHRGGARGFVRVVSERELVFPDYAGNNHFNTLGNLLMDPRAGLLFVDFEEGGLLQLTGRARIEWEGPDLERSPGAHRLVHFEIDELVHRPGALSLRWTAPDTALRRVRVVEKRRESADVASFVLAAPDGRPLPEFSPGQHLPVALEIPGETERVVRTYSLSSSRREPDYRITVKREPHGLASRHLHDAVHVGEFILTGAPQGGFTLGPDTDRPIVLASAGVGSTPLVSMLDELVYAKRHREVWFVHGARDGEHHPLHREVRRLVAASPAARLHVAYSRPIAGDRIGRDYDESGRVDGPLLERLVPGLDADFYICGPTGFMADLHAHLDAAGVPAHRIRSESFGPSA